MEHLTQGSASALLVWLVRDELPSALRWLLPMAGTGRCLPWAGWPRGARRLMDLNLVPRKPFILTLGAIGLITALVAYR